MEKDSHPNVSQDSYRVSKEICTIPSHIEFFNEKVKQEKHRSKPKCLDFTVEDDFSYFCRYADLIVQTTESYKEQSEPVLTKKLTPAENTGNK